MLWSCDTSIIRVDWWTHSIEWACSEVKFFTSGAALKADNSTQRRTVYMAALVHLAPRASRPRGTVQPKEHRAASTIRQHPVKEIRQTCLLYRVLSRKRLPVARDSSWRTSLTIDQLNLHHARLRPRRRSCSYRTPPRTRPWSRARPSVI